MSQHRDHYTEPSRATRLGYRFLYDPLRAGYLRRLVASLELLGSEHVLDVGSGAGSEAVYLARALDQGGRLTCLDVSPTWLAEARRRLRGERNVEYVLGRAPLVDLPAERFDLILAHFVLHDIERADLPETLVALARSLRPDGRFVVVEPDGSPESGRGMVPSHHRLSDSELRTAMAAAGLVEHSRDPVRPPFGAAVQIVFTRAAAI